MTPLLTLKETAAWLHAHPSSLYRMVKARSIPFFRIGSDLRFDVKQVQEWMISECSRNIAFRKWLLKQS